MQSTPEGEVPRTIWHVTGIHVDSSPALAGGKVFVGSVVGDEHRELCAAAIDAASGRVLWRVPAPLPLAGAPAASGGRVFFSLARGKLNEEADSPEGRIWCLRAADGQREWEFRAAGAIFGSPVVAGNRVFCAGRDGCCYALDVDDGKVLWKTDLGEPIVTTPIVSMPIASGGRLFALSIGGSLFALDAASGAEIWRFDAMRTDNLDVYSSPVLAQGRIYAASGGKLYSIGDAAP
jgi:outer membrane protein assembly factor BamB